MKCRFCRHEVVHFVNYEVFAFGKYEAEFAYKMCEAHFISEASSCYVLTLHLPNKANFIEKTITEVIVFSWSHFSDSN